MESVLSQSAVEWIRSLALILSGLCMLSFFAVIAVGKFRLTALRRERGRQRMARRSDISDYEAILLADSFAAETKEKEVLPFAEELDALASARKAKAAARPASLP